jgi:phosphoglycolate phosphatase-like HAD superfamily hydrolase
MQVISASCSRRAAAVVLLLACAVLSGGGALAADPLPSWTESPAKSAIIAFVEKVTTEGPGFVPEPERIAVFDNDGTLWPENPVPFQAAYVVDELRRRVPDEPGLQSDPMVQALLAGNMAPLMAGEAHDGLMHVISLTHAGMTTQEFEQSVTDWIAVAKHPRFQRRYDDLSYQPMQEVLRYLAANGFKNFIVSGGGADFMRVWSERVYGIPPERVVGTTARVIYELRPDGPVLVKTMDQLLVDDKAGKPAGIHQFIGRRPIAVFGNSDGDKELLEYGTISNPHPSLGVLIHHTDGEREYAYDLNPKSSGSLKTALADAPLRGWIVVSMKDDWKRIFNDP